jgi:putative peptidoglycan lipid II flippase
MFRYDLARHGEESAWANVSILFNNLVFLLIFIALAAWLLAPALVSLMSPGFEEETNALATALTRITIISIVLIPPSMILEQILFSYERFFLPGITDLVNNLVTVFALLVLGTTYGIYGLATAIVLGAACEFASQLPILWEKWKFYRCKIDLRHPEMREVGRLSLPLLFANSSVEVARITDRIFASLLPAGSLSALAFASRQTTVFLDLFVTPIGKSTFPHFTKLIAEENFQVLSRQISHYFRVLLFLTVPIAVGTMIVAEPIVRILYQRGAFDETSVRITSQSLACYAIGFPALALGRVLTRTFVSLKDTWTPTKQSIIRIGIKVILSWVLVQHFAHVGLALAESASQIIRTLLMFFLLPDQVKGQEEWHTIKSFGQTLAACVLMGVVVYLVKEQISGFFSVPVELVALVLLGIASYGTIAFLRKGEELQSVLKAFTVLSVKALPRKS